MSQRYDRKHVHGMLCRVMDDLVANHCDAIILGCTEIPLAIEEAEYRAIPIINPLLIMARTMIQKADASKLRMQ